MAIDVSVLHVASITIYGNLVPLSNRADGQTYCGLIGVLILCGVMGSHPPPGFIIRCWFYRFIALMNLSIAGMVRICGGVQVVHLLTRNVGEFGAKCSGIV